MEESTKVLIVDDEAYIRLNLRALLEDLGLRVVEAADGREGLEVFGREQPDLILTDLQMPIMDGMALTTAIQEKCPETPVIIVSGTGTARKAVDSLRLGAWDYIFKPFTDSQELEIVIKRTLEKARLLKENRRYREHLEDLVRERTEELHRSEARYRRLLESVTNYVFTVTFQGGQPAKTVHGLGCQAVTGFSPEEYVSDPYLWHRMIHEEDRNFVEDMTRRIPDETLPLSFEHRIYHKDGTVRWVQTTLVPHQSSRGECLYYDGIVADITERKNSMEKLYQVTQTWERTFDAVPDLIAILDTDFRIMQVNKAMAARLGHRPEGCVGEICYRAVHGTETPPPFCPHRQTLNTHQEQRAEIFEESLGGDFIVSTSPIFNSANQLIGSVHVARDITERKQAEEKLKETEEQYRMAIESSNDGIAMVRDDRHLFVNQRFLEIFGYDRPEEILEQPMSVVIHPEDLDRVANFTRLRQQGEPAPSRYEFKGIRRDGREVFIEVSATRTTYRGALVSLAFLRDITERKKLESMLQQAQKMEAIGTLAGGIAHDFNNILAVIIGCTELSLLDTPEHSSLFNHLRQVLTAGHRAADLVQQILTFSRKKVVERKPLMISLVIKEALKMIRSSLPSTIQIDQNIQQEAGLVLSDPTQIHQLLMNLSTNAAHAMREKGGVLKVSLSNLDISSGNQAQYPGTSPGNYLLLVVSDTGVGMNPAILEKIFDPYFTTKEPGEGTGLGLAVVHGIVESYGGTILVQSEPGQGTIFQILLPRIDPPKTIARDEPFFDKIPKGWEKILFVDDEAILCQVGKQMLENLGYEVTLTSDSLEALKIFRDQPDRFDLVITDMTMPHMTGDKLAQEIMKIRADMPVILCSGFSERITGAQAQSLGIRKFLEKPLSMTILAKTIRETLDNH
jgi:PAS domain S-box-containing protein